MKLIKSQLFTSNPKLVASLFTFLFDLEPCSEHGEVYFVFENEYKLFLIEANNLDNHLSFKLSGDYLDELAQKIELFNYKNNSEVVLNSSVISLDEQILFSVI